MQGKKKTGEISSRNFSSSHKNPRLKKPTNKPKPHISTRLTPLPEELFEAALACTVITCPAQAGAEAQVYLIAISERGTDHKSSSPTSPGTAQLTSNATSLYNTFSRTAALSKVLSSRKLVQYYVLA